MLSLRSHSIIMPSENHDPTFDYEEEVDRAKRFKDDLSKGGWKKTDTYVCELMQEKIPVSVVSISKCLASLDDSVSQYWIKTFPGEEVPIKLLFKWKMPIPAKTCLEMIQPAHIEVRRKWDDNFVDHELLETYPNGENVVYMRVVTPWPVVSRSYVLLNSPIKEIDWYGKQAYIIFQRNMTHSSKPEGEDGMVRAYNGGNFYLAVPDENEPERACEVLGLSNNLFNGWIPDTEFVTAKLAPRGIDKLRESTIKAYNTYFDYYTKTEN